MTAYEPTNSVPTGFYNPRRRHSALDYLSPADFERRYRSIQKITAA